MVLFGATLAGGFVEKNRRGDGGVEAFDRAGHGDGDAGLGAVEEVLREAAAFVADEDGRRPGEVVFRARDRAGTCGSGDGGEDGDFAFAQGREGDRGFFRHDGDTEGGAGGGAEGFAVPHIDGARQGDDAGGSEGFCGADEGAEVAGVLQSSGDEDERRGVSCARHWRVEFAESFSEGEVGRLEEGGDALRGFGVDGTGEDGGVERDDGDGRGQGKAFEDAEGGVAAVGIGAEEDGAQAEAAAEGFGEQVLALDPDDLGAVAGGAREGCPQFADAGVLATLYNADEARAIRSRRHGGILEHFHFYGGVVRSAMWGRSLTERIRPNHLSALP